MVVVFNQTLLPASLVPELISLRAPPLPPDLLSLLFHISLRCCPPYISSSFYLMLQNSHNFPAIFPVNHCYHLAQEKVMDVVWDFVRDKGKYLMSVSIWKIILNSPLCFSWVQSPLSNLACPTCAIFQGYKKRLPHESLKVPITYFIK